MNYIVADDLGALSLINPDFPVFYEEQDYLDYPNEAFIVMPITGVQLDYLIACKARFIFIAHYKKDIDLLKKKGIIELKIDVSISKVLDSLRHLGPLTRASMGLGDLKSVSHQIQAATTIALLGESKESINYAKLQHIETKNFAIQEAFLQMDLSLCLKLLDDVKPSDCVGVAALLLSGHTLAFALKDGSITELGVNAYYANKIQDLSVKYVRKAPFEKVTLLLAGYLGQVKEGSEPHHLLRQIILKSLSI